MRHRRTINHLGRESSHRKALLSNLASSLILHKKVNTTLIKGKELRKYVEPLITKSKEDTTHSRRVVFSYLGNKQAVSELFREIAKKISERPGGYTRIFKTGFRKGDNAETCLIELVDFNENYLEKKIKEEKKAKTTRRGRSTTKKKAEPQDEVITEELQDTEVSTEGEEIAPVEKPKKKSAKNKEKPETPETDTE
jgi:large subunit ribosomal protein L17